MNFQRLLLGIQGYWADRGCVIHQPYDIEVGDTFEVAVPGCNKLSQQHCRNRYDNLDNHRGFPHMVGADQVIQAPDAAF